MAQLRTLAVPVGVLAAVLLFLLVNPWIVLDGAISQIVTVAFWVSFILLLIILFSLRDDPDTENIEVEGPAHELVRGTEMAHGAASDRARAPPAR